MGFACISHFCPAEGTPGEKAGLGPHLNNSTTAQARQTQGAFTGVTVDDLHNNMKQM